MTITEFLLARIAEDEAAAKAAAPWSTGSRHEGQPLDWSIHFDRWSPARVLAECKAKRAIIELHAPVRDEGWLSGEANDHLWCGSCGSIDDSPEPYPCDTLKALAAVYAEHSEYRQEWASA